MEARFSSDQHTLINPNRPELRYIDLHMRPNCFKLSKRYTLAILAHLGFLIIFAMRSNLCFFNEEKLEKFYGQDGNGTEIFKMWEIEETMDISFLLAYAIVQIPAGIIAYKYPSQLFFGICILASSIMAIIQSLTLNWETFEFGYAAFFQGLVQSSSFAALHGIMCVWASPSERATLTTIAYSGTFMGVLFGTAFSFHACAYFDEEHFLAFYGIAGIIWYFAWIWLVFERPEDHPTIEDSEFEYLKRHVKVPETKPPIPWGKIFTSMPCWAVFVVYLCRSFNSYYLFQADYSQINYITIHGDAIGYELPALVMVIFVPASGYLADKISSKTSLSITQIRKYYICGGLLIELIAYLPSLFLDKESWGFLFDTKVFDMICYSFTISGYFVNHLDIAPIFACILISISNLFGAALGLFMSHGIHHKPYGLRIFFSFMAVFHLVGIVFYGIWGSGEIQPWAKTNDDESDPKSNNNSTRTRDNGFENPNPL